MMCVHTSKCDSKGLIIINRLLANLTKYTQYIKIVSTGILHLILIYISRISLDMNNKTLVLILHYKAYTTILNSFKRNVVSVIIR